MKPLFIARQGRRPSGLLGRIVAMIMAGETSPENDQALELLDLCPDDNLVELGSGHGATLAKASRIITNGRLAGVDFSPVMDEHARRRNRVLIRRGRLTLHLGGTDHLPFPDDSFTKALTVHTIYFWEDPAAHLGEIHRVLVPGGRFVLGFRPAEDDGFAASFPDEVYAIRPRAEVIDMMRSSGFDRIQETRASFGHRQMIFATADT
jgi:ubiquinone/menaquinone biosynthesis C-methylase UbiE